MINQFRVRHIDNDVIALHEPNVFDLSFERNPIAEHRRFARMDLYRIGTDLFYIQIGLKEGMEWDTIEKVDEELHPDSCSNTDQQIGSKGCDQCRHKDDQLLATYMEHVHELARVRQPETGINEHGCECRKRDHVQYCWEE